MMIINKQDKVSTSNGVNENQRKDEKNVLIYLVWMEVEIVGDYGDYVRFQ